MYKKAKCVRKLLFNYVSANYVVTWKFLFFRHQMLEVVLHHRLAQEDQVMESRLVRNIVIEI